MSDIQTSSIPVVVTGALGRMGAEVIRAVDTAPDCHLVGAVDNTPGKEGLDVGANCLGFRLLRWLSRLIWKAACVLRVSPCVMQVLVKVL